MPNSESNPLNGTINIVRYFVESVYYIISITVVVAGVIVWTVRQEGRINELANSAQAAREDNKDLRTKDEALRVILDQHRASMETQIATLDRTGSREFQVAQATLNRTVTTVDRLVEKTSQISARLDVDDTQLKIMKETLEARTQTVIRVEQLTQDVIVLKQQIVQQKDDIMQIKERIDRIVSALDQTYNLLNEHLRANGKGNGNKAKVNPP